MDTPAESFTEVAFSGTETNVPNAAWTWFTDERVIVDLDSGSGGPRILVGTVTASDGPDGGDINVLWYDTGRETTGHVTLHDALEQDDHNGPALFIRPDGRYLAMYAKHGNDSYTRWRVTTEPHDPTNWEPEQTLDNGTGTTYCNVYRLPQDADGAGRTYCFTRTNDWNPTTLVSTDYGSSWSNRGRLLERGDETERPYVRYWGDGERIHLTTTEDHPHQYENSIYHGYVQDGVLYDSNGLVVSDSVLSDDEFAPKPSELTTVFEAGTKIDGTTMTRGWTVDVASDDTGAPVTVFQARVDDDPTDHRFLYARFTGTEWQVNPIASAGSYLYDNELDYTGLAAINPDDPSQVVISTPIDPRDETMLDQYELFAGRTADDGATWVWTPLTPDASTDNFRPLIPARSDDSTTVLWMRGGYETYVRWETQAVGLLDMNDVAE